MVHYISPRVDDPILTPKMLVKDRRIPDKGLVIFSEYMMESVRKYVDIKYCLEWLPGNNAFIF